MSKGRVRMALIALGLSLGGCLSLDPVPDPVRFYTLAPTESMIDLTPGGRQISFAQVDLSGYLDTTEIVVRLGTHELEFREFQRWAEPPSEGVARAVLAGLAARMPVAEARIFPRRAREGDDLKITLSVLRLEGDAAAGVARATVLWQLEAAEQPVEHGRFSATKPWDGENYAALVAALGELLDEVAGDIAEAAR